jgi:predicted O-linked N-acetylglucosamine transferase (SPINDLY family)
MTKRRISGNGLPSVATKVSKAKVRKRQASALEAAVARHQAGDLAAAEAGYQAILASSASQPRALHLLGTLHAQTGRLASAVDLLEQALRADPHNAESHNNLGLARHGLGEVTAATASFREAVRLNPRYSEALNNLGDTLRETGQPKAAIAALHKAVHYNPGYAAAHNNLGIAYHDLECWEDAARCFERALALLPNDYKAHKNLGLLYREKKRLAEAQTHLEVALALDPRDAELLLNLGATVQELEQHDYAMRCYMRALELDPDMILAHNNLGALLRERGELTRAIDHLSRAIEGDPECAEAYSNLGSTLSTQGRQEEAEHSFRRALALRPDRAIYYSNLLSNLAYSDRHTAREIAAEHREWAVRHAQAVPCCAPAGPRDRGDQHLRIGYLSPDFRRHAVATFLEPIFRAHDRSRFAIYGYSNVYQPDATTERFRELCDGWRDIVALDDDQAAARIAADGIDVLVDLSGHLAHNRLAIFARRPAPVQVAYLGYGATTGLAAIDYRLTDEYTDPPGNEDLYVERLQRLPEGWLCFQPPDAAPAVGPLPMATAGRVTFGSFNNLAKVTPTVVALWSRVLQRLPNATLVMKSLPLRDPGTRDWIRQQFAAQGVAPERLELMSWTATAADHFQLYNRIDLCLDTFPYNGGTTTCEALWMGVPVVTLAGNRSVSRFGVTILSRLGLSELVAADADRFVATAVTLARCPERLADLRGRLRDTMAVSSLCQPEAFTRQLEDAYDQMYRTVDTYAESPE